MNLHRIESFDELLSFLPKLNELYRELDGKWDQELSNEDFIGELTNTFQDSNHFFGAFDNQQLVYFMAILSEPSEIAYFWLFYMNKNYRTETGSLIEQVKAYFRSLGHKRIEFASTRLTSSYKRWTEKFGAKQKAIIYTLEL